MGMLETRKLAVGAGKRVLVDGLDWQVGQGEFWCILGRNGAGKSSLLQVVSGLRTALRGEVNIAGRALAKLSALELAQLRGLMWQQLVDSFSCTVFDAAAIGRTPWRFGHDWDADDDARRVQAALARVGMGDRANDDILNLSGGERQRVAFAAMLVQDPALMLFDEPTAHQDVAQQLLLMRLMRELSEGHAVVASCHDINLVARFATHVLLLGPGFHCAGKASDVLTVDNLGQAFGCRFTRSGELFVAA